MTQDWSEVLVALLAAGARVLVVGAHALAVHGIPRATQDLDIWIEPTADNAERVWEALALRNKRAAGRLKDLADVEALGEEP